MLSSILQVISQMVFVKDKILAFHNWAVCLDSFNNNNEDHPYQKGDERTTRHHYNHWFEDLGGEPDYSSDDDAPFRLRCEVRHS